MKRPSIVEIAAAVPDNYIDLAELAQVRGVDPNKFLIGLGCKEMAVCSPGEDSVTLAIAAAEKLFQARPEAREKVALCIAGTESGVDSSKPLSIYLHQFLELPSHCRTFEVKHACYGATAALQSAVAWLHLFPDKYALIVASDVARYELYTAAEPTQGAGAVAMLVTMAEPEDSFLQLYPKSGIYSQEVLDFWRPNYQHTPIVKGKYSVQCYLDALEQAYQNYLQQDGIPKEFDYLLFHLPFPKIAKKAHRRLMERQGLSDEGQIAGDYERRVAPQIWGPSKIGNTYTASLYFALYSLAESCSGNLSGKIAGLFSYGSGCCSEFFAGKFGEKLPSEPLSSLLSRRKKIDIKTYEESHIKTLEMEKNNSFDPELPSRGHSVTYLGVRNHERIYRREKTQ